MCGRFSRTYSYEDLRELFRLTAGLPLKPRYNIAPSQHVAAVREDEGRRLVDLHWGLIPFWAADPKTGYKMINARAETADKLPAFRAAFRSRRCLIPARGFFEWDRAGGTKQPYHITRVDGAPLALAGLWEHWTDKEGKIVIESCAILTTAANEEVARLHERMPVILEPGDFDLWLDPLENRPDRLKSLLLPAAAGTLSLQPVSRYVNKAANDDEKCIEPISL